MTINIRTILFTVFISTSICNTFAYTTTLKNQSSVDIQVTADGGRTIIQTIKANSDANFNLDIYTAYKIIYQGEYAPQTIMTIQKNSNAVIQNTPLRPVTGLQNLHIIFNSNSFSGDFYTLYQNGMLSFSGSCFSNVDGITCTTANGDYLTSLNLTISSDSGH